MRNWIILFVMVFFILGCAVEPQKTETIVERIIEYKGETWVLTGANQQIYPEPQPVAKVILNKLKGIFSGQMLCAADPPSVTFEVAEADLITNGKIYAENSNSSPVSYFKDQIHYIDVGSIVGHKEKLLIRVKFEMTGQGNNANSPSVHIRAKGSKDKWEILNPTLLLDDSVLIVTNDEGIIEWYHDNGAPETWLNGTTGYDIVVGNADAWIVMNDL